MIVNVIAATWLAGKVPSVTLRMQITILKQFLLLLEKRSRIIKSTEIASTCKVRLHDLLNKVHSYEIKLQQSTLLLTSFLWQSPSERSSHVAAAPIVTQQEHRLEVQRFSLPICQ